MLEVNGITTKYGPVTALLDVSMSVAPGEIVAIVGANGVGKTTLLRTIGGLLRPAEGSISLNGENLTRFDAHQRIKRGIVLVPEGRCLFHDLTVYENLLLGTFSWRRRATPQAVRTELDACYSLFPILQERSTQLAGTLSGGQQQMVAVGRGLMSRPSILLLDEPSLGLAPLVARQIFQALLVLREQRDLSIILVEQDAQAALSIAVRGYVMQRARIVMSGPGHQLRDDPLTREIYFGKKQASATGTQSAV